MKLSRTTAYALQAILQLAESPPHTPIPCRQLAKSGRMPERFLLQVLRNLVTKGFLQSTRGVDGGYFLHRRIEEISILELIEAVEGPLRTELPEKYLTPDVAARLRDEFSRCCNLCRERLSDVKLSSLLAAAT